MSKVRDRLRTQRLILDRRKQFGDFHPATFAAYGRAFVAWDGQLRPPRIPERIPPSVAYRIFHAYTISQLRAYGSGGSNNRRMRQYLWSGGGL